MAHDFTVTVKQGGHSFTLDAAQLARLSVEAEAVAVRGGGHVSHAAAVAETLREHWIAALWFGAESVAQCLDGGGHLLTRALPMAGALAVPVAAHLTRRVLWQRHARR